MSEARLDSGKDERTGRESVASTLAVSIVTYRPGWPVLETVLKHLAEAAGEASAQGRLARTDLCVVDNSTDAQVVAELQERVAALWPPALGEARVVACERNVGYGLGHNRALRECRADYHLVMNPDVIMARDALVAALGFMAVHPEAGLLAPYAEDGTGAPAYLCKRYPSVADLLLRGFAPAWLQRFFAKRLARYEMRDLDLNRVQWGVPLASGCFMFFRRGVLERLGGFSSDYFMYFEDFDLSMRTAALTRIAYVPAVRIVHLGGLAGQKGFDHVLMFARSARRFFSTHGWKWW